MPASVTSATSSPRRSRSTSARSPALLGVRVEALELRRRDAEGGQERTCPAGVLARDHGRVREGLAEPRCDVAEVADRRSADHAASLRSWEHETGGTDHPGVVAELRRRPAAPPRWAAGPASRGRFPARGRMRSRSGVTEAAADHEHVGREGVRERHQSRPERAGELLDERQRSLLAPPALAEHLVGVPEPASRPRAPSAVPEQ